MNNYILLLYIDPGTGAMLFTTLIGLITSASFAFRKWGIKLKFILKGGKVDVRTSSDRVEYVIFSDHKRYWNVFKPICDEFEKRRVKCSFWTASQDDPALEENYEYVNCTFIGEGNRAYAQLNMMNAGVCLATTPGLDVYQWKRSKNCDFYVHIPHSVGSLTMYRMFGLDFYDSILMNADYQENSIRKLEILRNLKHKEFYTVGCTYFDTMKERLDAVKTADIIEKENITVLLAPSWGSNAILSRFGNDFLRALKNTGFNIIVRPHPQSKISEKHMLDNLEKEFPETDFWHWNYDNDNFSVLREADIMISDFSGVIYDYVFVFNGALIYTEFNFDKSVYDAAWLDEPIEAETVLPQIGRMLRIEDIQNIRTVIEDTISSEEYAEGRKRVGEKLWMYRGEARARTVDYLLKINKDSNS